MTALEYNIHRVEALERLVQQQKEEIKELNNQLIESINNRNNE